MAMIDNSISQGLVHDYQNKIDELEGEIKRLENIFKNAQIGIFHVSHNGKITLSNPAIRKLCGYNSKKHFHSIADIGKDLFADYKEKDSLFKKLNKKKTVKSFITKFKRCDGIIIYVSIDVSILTSSENGMHKEFYVQDITKHRKIEEHNRLLSSVVEQSAEGIAIADTNGNLLFSNNNWVSMHGYNNSEEVIGQNLSIFHSNKQLKEDVELFNQIVMKKGHYTGEVGHMRKDGSIFPTRMTTTLLRDEKNIPYAITGVANDITDQKMIEEELHQTHSHLKATLNALPDLLFEVNNKGFIFDFRAPQPKLLLIPSDKFLGKTIYEVLPPDACNIIINAINDAAVYGQHIGSIYSLNMPTGQMWFELAVSIKGDPMANDTRFIVIARNITDRKKAEEKVKTSLKEKEVLLKEIHHRVKNNMQIIISLLNLQSSKITDENALNVFTESSNRIRAMSLVHEVLYQYEDLGRVDLKKYVNNLIHASTRVMETKSTIIEYCLNVDSIALSIDYTIPIALILNELLTNVNKYAFQGMEKGNVDISIKKTKNETIEIQFADNGIGIPEEVDFKNPRTLGLQIVSDLTEGQLGGTLKQINENGCLFIIRFNVGELNKL